MHILITGGAGFIGQSLARQLAHDGHHIKILNRPGVKLDRLREACPAYRYFPGTVADPHCLTSALAGSDMVIHLAHTSIPAQAQQNPVADLEENVRPVYTLLSQSKEHAVRRVVFLSSGGTVYGPTAALPISEQHPTAPISVYGACKLSMESYVRAYGLAFGVETLILRLANPYGAGKTLGTQQGVVSEFIRKMRDSVPLEIWGDGSAIRDYIYLPDVCAIIGDALRRPLPTPSFTANLGTGVGTSLSQLIRMLEELLDRKAAIRYLPGRPIDVPANVLDIARLREWLGLTKELTPLPAGLRQLIAPPEPE